jgi:hypothetical protein
MTLRGAPWRIHLSFTPTLVSFPFRTNSGEAMGQHIEPRAARDFVATDLLQGILVISSFGFWAVMLGLMPVLLVRVWLAS